MNIQAEVIHTGSSTPQTAVLAGPSSLLKAGNAARVTLLIPETDVVVYERLGDDLVLTLADGRKIRLEDFFRNDADGEPSLRFVDGEHAGGGDFADTSFHNAPQGIVEPAISGQSHVGASAAVGLMALAGAVVGGAAAASSSRGKDDDNTGGTGGGTGGSTGGGTGDGSTGGGTGGNTGGGTGNGNTGSGTGDSTGSGTGNGNTGDGTGGSTGSGTDNGNTGSGTGGSTGGSTGNGNTGGGTGGNTGNGGTGGGSTGGTGDGNTDGGMGDGNTGGVKRGIEQSVEITAVSSGTGESSSDFVTREMNFEIRGKATLDAGDTVQIHRSGWTEWKTVEVADDGTWHFVDQAVDGRYTYEVRVLDHENHLIASARDRQEVEVDTQAPSQTVEVMTVDSRPGSDGGFITNEETPVITGKLSSSLKKGESLQIKVDDDVNVEGWSNVEAVNGVNWSYNVAGDLTEGGHTVHLRVVDKAGNTGNIVDTAVEVDTTPPPLDVSSTNDGKIHVESEGGTLVTFKPVKGSNGGAASAGAISYTVPDNGVLEIPASALANLGETFTVSAEDAAGNESENKSLTVAIDPSAAVHKPKVDAVLPSEISGKGVAGDMLRAINETTGQTIGTATVDDDYTFSITPGSGSISGGDKIRIEAVDSNGTSLASSDLRTVTSDLMYTFDHSTFSEATITSFVGHEITNTAGDKLTANFASQKESRISGSIVDRNGTKYNEGYAGNDGARTTTLGDFNGDGISDILFSIDGFHDTIINVFAGKPDGGFEARGISTALKEKTSGQDNSQSTLTADVDNDGILDYVHTHDTVSAMQMDVYLGKGDGSFEDDPVTHTFSHNATVGWDLEGQSDDQSTFLADMDGDGNVDYVYGKNGTDIRVLLGNGDGTFSKTPKVTDEYKKAGYNIDKATFVGDFNGDGIGDYLYAERVGEDTRIDVLLGSSDRRGEFDPKPISSTLKGDRVGIAAWTGASLDQSTHVFDVNGDGRLDYVFIHDGNPTNNGTDRNSEGVLTAYLADEKGEFSDDRVIEMDLPKGMVGMQANFELYTPLLGNHFVYATYKTQEGTTAGEPLNGGNDADRLIGHGGKDTISAGGGDDLIFVPDLNFTSVDGGLGVDRLAVTDLEDLSGLAKVNISGVEILDLTGSGKNTLTLDPGHVKQLSKNITGILRIDGDSEDVVTLHGFRHESKPTETQPSGDTAYELYTQGNAQVWVDTDIQVVV
ncbi:Ig-like domain-containing protein [Chelativorans alearense]|uniref:Ig-like domain-containing protein n=1 Tax=Chelativorans alearense TaxID=2681495 RepID=UPI001969FB78|nr:Ig-like domain-containing protein [Chelativorans alearense]